MKKTTRQKIITLGLLALVIFSALGQSGVVRAQALPTEGPPVETLPLPAPLETEFPFIDTLSGSEISMPTTNLPADTNASGSFYEDCSGINPFSDCRIRNIIRSIGQLFKWIFGGVLGLVGILFDKTIYYSVVKFEELANNPAVKVAWAALRDVANIFFIFILLYAAIAMILQLSNVNGRRILVNVIIIALLINFSAFFTRLVIDVSNVAAYQFYKNIAEGNERANISAKFMGTLELGASYNLTVNDQSFSTTVGEEPGAEITGTDSGFMKTAVLSFGVIVMLIVAIFIFLAAAILFVIRTVTLLFLIILSPLAFLMYAFPNQKGLYDKWWDTLLKQSFFAPLYLLMVWVALEIAPILGTIANEDVARTNFVDLIFAFLLVIGLMFGALIIAKSLGAKGASAAMKGAGALTGAAAGVVGWGTRKGLTTAWRMRTAEGREQMAASRKEFYGKVGTTLKDLKTNPIKTTAKGIVSGVKLAERKLPLGKEVGEFIRKPLKTTFEGLANVTKDYGVSGVLGRTRDEEAEATKKAKEEKERTRKEEIKKNEENLKRFANVMEKGSEEEKTRAALEIAKVLDKMKPKEIAGLDKSILKLASVIDNLSAEDLRAMNREGVDKGVMNEIFAYIGGRQGKGQKGDKDYVKEYKAKEEHPAYKYVVANPTRQMKQEQIQKQAEIKPTSPPKLEPGEKRPQVDAISKPATSQDIPLQSEEPGNEII